MNEEIAWFHSCGSMAIRVAEMLPPRDWSPTGEVGYTVLRQMRRNASAKDWAWTYCRVAGSKLPMMEASIQCALQGMVVTLALMPNC